MNHQPEPTAQDLTAAYRTACFERDITARLHRDAARLSPNLCHQCGTKFGMQIIYHDTLAACPLRPTETAYRDDQNDPPDADCIWQPCDYCNPNASIPAGFVPIQGEPTDE